MPVDRLSSAQLLKDNDARDADSISSLKLDQKALTDVRERSPVSRFRLAPEEKIFPFFFTFFSRFRFSWVLLCIGRRRQVSCLADFRNLQRLDLGFNNLTSLEVSACRIGRGFLSALGSSLMNAERGFQGLRPCVGLKWLSVVQNKLRSLKGIEGLSNLTVSCWLSLDFLAVFTC